MRVIRNITALISVVVILLGGIFQSAGWPGSRLMILIGLAILMFIFIPVFLYDLSKKWGDEE